MLMDTCLAILTMFFHHVASAAITTIPVAAAHVVFYKDTHTQGACQCVCFSAFVGNPETIECVTST